MQTLCVLPMRGGSKRIKGKNSADLGGHPLFVWILTTVSSLDCVHVVVDSDSYELLELTQSYFPDVELRLRRPELGLDSTSMNDVISDVLSDFPECSRVLQVHATNPFVSRASLEKGLQMVDGLECDSAFSVSKIHGRLWTQDLDPLNHDPSQLLPTQDLPPVLHENSSFYVFDRTMFDGTGRRIGQNPLALELAPIESIDIDYPGDLVLARHIASSMNPGALP